MKRLVKETIGQAMFLALGTMVVGVIVLPLVFMMVFPQEYQSYFSLFNSGHTSVWITMISANLITATVLHSLYLYSKIRQARAIVKEMATSGVSFDEAAVFVADNYCLNTDPRDWDRSQFVKDLWKLRQEEFIK